MIEQQDAAAEHLALVNRPERPCCGDMLGMHDHFQIAAGRREFFLTAFFGGSAASPWRSLRIVIWISGSAGVIVPAIQVFVLT